MVKKKKYQNTLTRPVTEFYWENAYSKAMRIPLVTSRLALSLNQSHGYREDQKAIFSQI